MYTGRLNPEVQPLTLLYAVSKREGVADSDLYYFKDKGSIKLTSKLEALGRTLLSEAIG